MPNKLQAYAEQAERTARQITGSHLAWTAFLTTAARLYKYPYNEQLMIYMQRPEATACAEYDFWNEKMGRYVRRGSTGIALIDATGYKPRLKYVFDVSDTGVGMAIVLTFQCRECNRLISAEYCQLNKLFKKEALLLWPIYPYHQPYLPIFSMRHPSPSPSLSSRLHRPRQ